mgnify:CR=1 FL=1
MAGIDAFERKRVNDTNVDSAGQASMWDVQRLLGHRQRVGRRQADLVRGVPIPAGGHQPCGLAVLPLVRRWALKFGAAMLASGARTFDVTAM